MLALQAMGHDPAVLRGGMGARTRCDPVPLAVPAWRPAAAGRGHRPLARSARASTAPPWTPCSSPPLSGGKDTLSSTSDESSGLTPARKPPRSTTTTTSAPACSLPPRSAALRATPASGPRTPGGSKTRAWHPAPHHGDEWLAWPCPHLPTKALRLGDCSPTGLRAAATTT